MHCISNRARALPHVRYLSNIKTSGAYFGGILRELARSTSLVRVLRHFHILVHPNNALGAFFVNLSSSIFTKYKN